MRSTKLLILVFVILGGCTTTKISDETKKLVVNGDASDGLKNWKGFEKVVDGGKEGKCFYVRNSMFVTSKKFIEVDASKPYDLYAMFKSGNYMKNLAYFGLLQYDKNKKQISATSVTPVKGTDTELAAACTKGDKEIIVKDAPALLKVFKPKRMRIIFETDGNGKYSDLPNDKISDIIMTAEKDGDACKLTLRYPIKTSYPEGTKVRLHKSCGHFMYVGNFNKNLKKWTKIGGTIKPEVKTGSPDSTFWRGTKYVKILILANWGQKEGEELLVDDIVFSQK